MKTRMLKLLPLLLILFTGNRNVSAGGLQANRFIEVMNDSSGCIALKKILKEEILPDSKAQPAHPTTRIIGCSEKQAFSKALSLPTKLNAKKLDIEASESVYELPDNMGHIIVQELYKDNVHIIISLVCNCTGMPFDEIQYVAEKYYQSIK